MKSRKGPWALMGNLAWDQMPEFDWCDVRSQIAWGLNDPARAGYSKETRNRMKREKTAEARVA
eukprot:4485311-Pyramimonas_sp.AAC.1